MPQMLKWRYISSFFDSNSTGKNMFATVPIWLMLTQYLLYPKTSGLGNVRTFNIMKYYLPPDHTLYENQSLWVCLKHSVPGGLPELLLHFLPEPNVDSFSFGFFGHLDEFLRASISMLVKGVTAWRIGKFIPYPFKVIYARYKAKLRHLPAQPL